MFQNFSINLKFVVLVFVMGVIFAVTFMVLNRVAGEIDVNWTDYRDQIAQRQKRLMDIKSQFGYGGGIHSFKNYVLRHNAKYFEKAKSHFEHAEKTIAAYRSIKGVGEVELEALEALGVVLDKYVKALLTAQAMFAAGKLSNEADIAIKVDDTPAFEAFVVLENVYDDMTSRTTDKIGASIAKELNTLILSLSFAFVVIVFFSVIIARSMTKPLEAALDKAKKSQLDLESSREAAEAANLSKSTFLANMSHEIRTPMNAILGYGQILVRGGDLTSKQKEGLENINKSGNHLLGLINDILDISKIESGAMELNSSSFDLHSAIRWISSMFSIRCEEKRLTWVLKELDEVRVTVQGDEGKLKQVLINLLGNAVKFTKKGKIELTVEKGDDNFYRFEVKDDGLGIDSSALRNIFEPFRQDQAGRQEGGTGLGLAISKKHIELMGGELGVDSQLGHGSRFYFTLPLYPAEEDVIASSELTGPDVLRLAAGFNVRSLVVDDNRFNRDVLSQTLLSIGVEVDQAENGKIALEMAQEHTYDIVFMDMRMPVMRGEEAVAKIQEKFGKDGPKVVAITASVFSHQKINFLEMGCHDFLSKPFQTHLVFQSMKNLLGLEYEYKEEFKEVAKVETVLEPADLSMMSIPNDLYSQLKEAVEFYQVTQIENIMNKLKQQGGDSKVLAGYLQPYINQYNMDGILEILGKLKNA